MRDYWLCHILGISSKAQGIVKEQIPQVMPGRVVGVNKYIILEVSVLLFEGL